MLSAGIGSLKTLPGQVQTQQVWKSRYEPGMRQQFSKAEPLYRRSDRGKESRTVMRESGWELRTAAVPHLEVTFGQHFTNGCEDGDTGCGGS
jgi:hypothetical protein